MFTIPSVFFVSFPVRLTELCVGDRKALQEPFVWITSRMVSCAGEDTIFFLFEIPTRRSEHGFFFSHKRVICNIDVVTQETNGTTAATEIKKTSQHGEFTFVQTNLSSKRQKKNSSFHTF